MPREVQTRDLVSGDVRLAQEPAAEGAQTLPEGTRPVELLAYTGGIVDVGFGPEVFDLAGMEIPTQKIPLLVDHDETRVAGYSSEIVKGEADLRMRGLVFVDEDEGSRVARRLDKGFPQQASVRVTVLEDEFVPAGQSRQINGRTLAGPFIHDRRSLLKETSFVPLGADANTRAVALAAAQKERRMADPKKDEEKKEDEVMMSDPVSMERQRVEAITAAIPDASMALQHVKAGSTLDQAKAAWADHLAKENEALKAQVQTVQAQLAERRPSSTLVPAVRPAGETGTRAASDGGGEQGSLRKFQKLVREARATGLAPDEAAKRVARENPDLHRQVLAEANPGKPEPAYRAGRR